MTTTGLTRRQLGSLSLGSAALSSTVLAAACGPAGGAPETANPSGKVTTVTFFSPASDTLGDEIMRDQTKKFNAANKSIQVDYVFTATDENYKQYTTAIVAGSAPDVMMTYDYPPIPQWQAKGLIQPLDQYKAEMKIKQEDYFANVWQMVNFGGKFYGFLQEFDVSLLAIGNDLVSKAGLNPNTPPKTIDELDDWNNRVMVKDGGAVTRVGIVPWRHGGYDQWAGLHGGGYFDAATGKFTINSKENVASLAWMAKSAKNYGGYDAVEALHKAKSLTGRPQYYDGTVVLHNAGEYRPVVYQKESPDWKFSIAFWPTVSGVTYGTAQTGGGNIFVQPKGAPHPKEGVAVMKFFAGADMVWDWNVRENNLPPVKSVANDPKFKDAVPLMAKWIDMLKIDKMKPALTTPLVDYFGTKRSEWGVKALKGEVSAQQALDELAREMDVQVKQFEQTKTLP